jgi:hypothetical protein
MNDETIQSHCGPDAFSPPAPQELCAVHNVPEPSTWLLLLVALLVAFVLRKRGGAAKVLP